MGRLSPLVNRSERQLSPKRRSINWGGRQSSASCSDTELDRQNRIFTSDRRMIVSINPPSLTREVIANVKLCGI